MAAKVKKEAILAALFSAVLVTAAAPGAAADKPEAGDPGMNMDGGRGMGGMEHKRGMEGMHGHGMHGMEGMRGMMNMMRTCRHMHRDAMARGIPQLPPGNEKLQLQMQAEIMQKTGEILAKYAAQVRE